MIYRNKTAQMQQPSVNHKANGFLPDSNSYAPRTVVVYNLKNTTNSICRKGVTTTTKK